MRQNLSLTAAVLLAGGGILAGCATHSDSKTFHTALTNAQEVPPTQGSGNGMADVTLNTATKQVSWKVSYGGLTSDATAAHIHGPAAPGTNAGIVVNLAPNGVKNPLEGSATLTDAQIADLMSGKYYVNVHTTQNKGGEIRGQLNP
jgi:Cu/Zn superoxide dismutase